MSPCRKPRFSPSDDLGSAGAGDPASAAAEARHAMHVLGQQLGVGGGSESVPLFGPFQGEGPDKRCFRKPAEVSGTIRGPRAVTEPAPFLWSKMAADVNEVSKPPPPTPHPPAGFKPTDEVPVTRETSFIDGNEKYDRAWF